ncbi:protein spaetzle 4 [Daktulosphaira vitifoliae]|uniref:protein spaetzle 4 n=1 Tax=Daktulosphaira vitifoliae TaxID=58002 RepID=UPI0021A9D51E|nr:protein spaetzle 4 [Daktulosphaira vitifoliae]
MYLKILLLWALPLDLNGYGYDGYSTCTKPYRNAKARLPDLPCDLNTQSWCMVPGSTYPWHAVRRFVFENHGLMKRMYGEQRHISVLRAELDTNDVEGGVWNRRREESSLNRYESHPSPKPSVPSFHSAASSSSTSTTTTSTTTTTTTTPSTTASTKATPNFTTGADTSQSFNVTELPLPSLPTTTEGEDDEDVTDVTADSDGYYDVTTAEPSASSERNEQVEQPGFFEESTTTDNPQKSKGINACPVKEEVVAPFWANNTRGEVLALLNLYPFEQYVHWERCTFENKQMFCRQGCRCEQQYRLHRLLAYDPSNDCRGIFSDWFKFPSCCVCRCYDLPNDLRITSRSPRTETSNDLDTWFQDPLNP